MRAMIGVSRAFSPALLAFVVACGGGGNAPAPSTPGGSGPAASATGSASPEATAALESPPPSGASKESPFPAVARAALPNGLGVAVVTSRTLPIVQVRAIVRAGASLAAPGVADLTGTLLKDGGTKSFASAELLRRVETLGSSLSIRTDFDATVLSVAVTKDQLDEALGLLAEVVREPRFDAKEFGKTKARAIDEAEDAARANGRWAAFHLAFRELFPSGYPYASYDATPGDLAKIDRTALTTFHARAYVPKATTLVLAGDVDLASAETLAKKHFGTWKGGEPLAVTFPPISGPKEPRIFLAHRPKSAQSDVFVASLGPTRQDPKWPAFRVATQVLGGGVASRLFSDVREQRSLAYNTSAQIVELAHGPEPLLLYAGTQSAKTAAAVAGLVENRERMIGVPPTAVETASATRYLSDIFAVRLETIGAVADMVVTADTLGLPDGYWDAYRKAVRASTPADAAQASKGLYAPPAIVVVVGDADVVGNDLTTFGDVTVVDPEKEFETIRTLPKAKR